ncbi:MAG: hypothetical protein AMJ92_10250 [candidate division Zixibacteria bacterium SM23_81]|nr:MAG: hypothetical protein AMJ92_10250 [candidate division Zixibacteria bacterium SM23_81]
MRISIILLTVVAAFFVTTAVAADQWSRSVDANLTLAQTAYSDNWAGGEAGNLSWTFNSNSLAERKLCPKVHTKNALKLSFGQNHNQDKETKNWAKPTKSTDLIDFETLFNFTLGAFADPFVAGRLESQFLDASDPEKNRYLNPLNFTESFGVIKFFIKEDKREWSNRLGAALRQHVNRDVLVDPQADKRETQTSNDGGLEFVSEFKSPIAQERITISSKLTVFQALFYSEDDALKGQPNEDYWESPDVNWENIFTASITKYLMVNLYTQILYDKEVDKGGRFKQTLSLGLTYKLI